MSEKLTVANLSGVPETMLWPLHNRAAEARRPDALFHDPEAIRIADAIEYDYGAHFGKPDFGHIIRAEIIDRILRAWLVAHPTGLVFALGEGLETQFNRVDNGQVRWFAVDVPEAIAVREQFLPNTDRHQNLSYSALDFAWMDHAEPDREIFVTMAGLLMYFEPEEVKRLLTTIAERFPRAEMMFDIIPRWFSNKTLKNWKYTEAYTLPPMPFGINRDEVSEIKTWHPNIAEIIEPPCPKPVRGLLFKVLGPIIEHTPWIKHRIPSGYHVICNPPQET